MRSLSSTLCRSSALRRQRLGGQRNLNAVGANPFVQVVDMAGGIKGIKDLQRHENHKIYDMAVKILENYLGVDDDQ